MSVVLLVVWRLYASEAPNADQRVDLRKLAEQGNVEAQVNLATLYWYNAHSGGQRKPPDSREFKECARWAEAASHSNPAAQALLASLYDAGLGVVSNKTTAFDLYTKAAYRMNPTAQYELAAKYESGDGIRTNLIEAYVWYSLASSNADFVLRASPRMKRIETNILQQFTSEADRRMTNVLAKMSLNAE